ncbi:MAG: SdiA-regulated domain-containing protein [Reichenbachiella sp.]|uniref:SdiA-regulated domain-containing protein n=1 Tax=Reichenbachiella sp. TaxID=2184521 RepID=UPI0032653ADB
MRLIILSLVFILSCKSGNSEKGGKTYQALNLQSVHQFISTDSLNFDFSGIVQKDDSIYVVADKPWNTFIYSIEFDDQGWYVNHKRQIISQQRFDLEAIDFCEGKFFLANEYTGSVYMLNPGEINLQELDINFEEHNLNPGSWKNAGWEGLAIDSQNEIMYLTKERQPRIIIAVDMKSWKIQDQFNIPQTESNDFADAKFENGYLYLLERNGNYITKINPTTKEVITKYHYRHIASHPDGKLYEPEKYGMAEALLLTEQEIWVGLDNNGLEVSNHARKVYQLKSKEPVLLKFERPENF